MQSVDWTKLSPLSDDEIAIHLAKIDAKITSSSEPLSLIAQVPFAELFSELLSGRSSSATRAIHSLLFSIFSLIDTEAFITDHKVPAPN